MSGVSEPLSRVKVGTLRRPEGPPEPMVVVPEDVEKEDVRILKVCFYSNSFNPGKNFKLVKCTVHTEIRVSVAGSPALSICLFSPLPSLAAQQPSFRLAGPPIPTPGQGRQERCSQPAGPGPLSGGLQPTSQVAWLTNFIASFEPQIICLAFDSTHFNSLTIYDI